MHSRDMLSYCIGHGPIKSYSYAITGINITFDVMQWFRTRRAAPFYYKYVHDGLDAGRPGLDAVHLLYCRAFVDFHRIWESDPPETVMGFSEIHKKFMLRMDQQFQKNQVTPLPLSQSQTDTT